MKKLIWIVLAMLPVIGMAQREAFEQQLKTTLELYRNNTDYKISISGINVFREKDQNSLKERYEALYIRKGEQTYSKDPDGEYLLSKGYSVKVHNESQEVIVSGGVNSTNNLEEKIGLVSFPETTILTSSVSGTVKYFTVFLNAGGITKVKYGFSEKGELIKLIYYYSNPNNPIQRTEIDLQTQWGYKDKSNRVNLNRIIKLKGPKSFQLTEKYKSFQLINSFDYEQEFK